MFSQNVPTPICRKTQQSHLGHAARMAAGVYYHKISHSIQLLFHQVYFCIMFHEMIPANVPPALQICLRLPLVLSPHTIIIFTIVTITLVPN